MRRPSPDLFVAHGGWFDAYRSHCPDRYPTFKLALNLFVQSGGRTIVETGCLRFDGFADGGSTILFADVAKRQGAYLFSVDACPSSVALARRATSFARAHRKVVRSDSVRFLSRGLPLERRFTGRIDLLYLDSQDYPIHELVAASGAFATVDGGASLEGKADDTIAAEYDAIVGPSQRHCLAELEAAWPYLHRRSVVLLDDNHWSGGGKPRLAKRLLARRGWLCLLDMVQSVWVPAAKGAWWSR